MQVGNQIKKYRDQLHLSQEQLAEKIYVTRQTISNWETNKSYPDIHSLVLLSQIFNVSIDQLVKGDLEMMKYQIEKEEVNKFNKNAVIYGALLLIAVLCKYSTDYPDEKKYTNAQITIKVEQTQIGRASCRERV